MREGACRGIFTDGIKAIAEWQASLVQPETLAAFRGGVVLDRVRVVRDVNRDRLLGRGSIHLTASLKSECGFLQQCL